jgi:hypothetical protein
VIVDAKEIIVHIEEVAGSERALTGRSPGCQVKAFVGDDKLIDRRKDWSVG